MSKTVSGRNFKALSSITKRLISGPSLNNTAAPYSNGHHTPHDWNGAFLTQLSKTFGVTITTKNKQGHLHFRISGQSAKVDAVDSLLTKLDQHAGVFAGDRNITSSKHIETTDYGFIKVHLNQLLEEAKQQQLRELTNAADNSEINISEEAAAPEIDSSVSQTFETAAQQPPQSPAIVRRKGKHRKASNAQAEQAPNKLIAPEFEPLNVSQATSYLAMNDDDVYTVFLVGPAGGGKTYVPTHFAIEAMASGDYEKLLLFRPRTVTGRGDMGAFPGGPNAKMEFYVKAFTNKVKEITGKTMPKVAGIEAGTPDGERGETYKNAVVIVDEAQNLTISEATMLLTRMGTGTKFIITGDISDNQNDLKGQHPGLAHLIATQAAAANDGDIALQKGMAFIKFTEEDASARHPLMPNILKAFNNPRPAYAELLKTIEGAKRDSALAKAIAAATEYARNDLDSASERTANKYVKLIQETYPQLFEQKRGNVQPLFADKGMTAHIA